MIFQETPLGGAFEISLDRKDDTRGFFARLFCVQEFERAGLQSRFVQINNSLSIKRGTLRGMHYQLSNAAETKLVRYPGLYLGLHLRFTARFRNILAVARLRAFRRESQNGVCPKGFARSLCRGGLFLFPSHGLKRASQLETIGEAFPQRLPASARA